MNIASNISVWGLTRFIECMGSPYRGRLEVRMHVHAGDMWLHGDQHLLNTQ